MSDNIQSHTESVDDRIHTGTLRMVDAGNWYFGNSESYFPDFYEHLNAEPKTIFSYIDVVY